MNRRAFLFLTISPVAWAGVGKSNVRYLGGSWPEVSEGREGQVMYAGEAIAFQFGEQAYLIDFKNITSLEYGQKVGRRIGAALILGSVWLLLSKKRKHFASIGYKNAKGDPDGVILEFGKNINRSLLKYLALRSGVKLEFETEQAEKEFRH